MTGQQQVLSSWKGVLRTVFSFLEQRTTAILKGLRRHCAITSWLVLLHQTRGLMQTWSRVQAHQDLAESPADVAAGSEGAALAQCTPRCPPARGTASPACALARTPAQHVILLRSISYCRTAQMNVYSGTFVFIIASVLRVPTARR